MPAPDPAVLADLDRRLRALARHDRRLAVFGAAQHAYEGISLSPEDLEAARVRHGAAALPAAWVWWVSEGPGVGAGPFYGLQHPEDVDPATGPLAGALPLSDHGCGYSDWLVTSGERAGEVLVDLREGGGDLRAAYPSFEAWLDAWLVRAFAEWGIASLDADVPPGTEPDFLEAVRRALGAVLAGSDDPMLALYPLPIDKAHGALGTLHLVAGDPAAAGASFEAAAAASKEPDAWRALGRCRLAAARGDAVSWLAAADEGLRAQPLWWITKGQLLIHRVRALEHLARWDDEVAAREAVADHFRDDLQKNLDLVWIRMLRRETALAAARVRQLADRGVGCDREASGPERLRQVAGGLLAALRDEGMADRAEALEAALAAA